MSLQRSTYELFNYLTIANKSRMRTAYLQESLKICRFLISQIEEAVSGMMSMKPQFSTIFPDVAIGTHAERSLTSTTEFVFALGAGKMHAASPCKEILKGATGTLDSALFQLRSYDSFLLNWIVILLPLREFFTGYPEMLNFPLPIGKSSLSSLNDAS